MYLDLDTIKTHLNVDLDWHDDDAYILELYQAAEKSVEIHVNRPLEEIVDENGCELPAPLIQAMLLLIGELYRNREITGKVVTKLPYSYQYLIELYKNWLN